MNADALHTFGRAARENDFIRAAGVDEFRSAFARGFKSGGGAIAQFMDAAMHVGVIVLIIMNQRLNDRAWFLRRGGIVEINQRPAVDLLVKDWKVLSERSPVSCLRFLH